MIGYSEIDRRRTKEENKHFACTYLLSVENRYGLFVQYLAVRIMLFVLTLYIPICVSIGPIWLHMAAYGCIVAKPASSFGGTRIDE